MPSRRFEAQRGGSIQAQGRNFMSSAKQSAAARHNVKKAAAAAKSKKTITHLSKATRAALGKKGAQAAQQHKENR
jgi:hypothetical protein